jgi:hypothetical protein
VKKPDFIVKDKLQFQMIHTDKTLNWKSGVLAVETPFLLCSSNQFGINDLKSLLQL